MAQDVQDVSLKSKLNRLPAPVPVAVTATSCFASDDPKTPTLEDLRAKMDELLHKQVSAAKSPANPSQTTLPFLPATLGTGRLHRRCLQLPRSKTIGRIPVSAASAAKSDLLSLLALDPRLLPCDPRRALYLDTETTGLGGGAGTIAFLVGLAWFADDELWLEQLLLTSPVDEAALLEALDERLAQASMLVTFNGKSFDWPLLMGRYVMNHRPAPAQLPHLDLLHVARRLHKQRIGSVTLKRVESEVLGLQRGPDIDGAEIGPRYAHYLRTGDETALQIVIEHNATDVLSMAALVGLYGEPIEMFAPMDLVGLGRTHARAGQHDRALEIAEHAYLRGAGSEARRLTARLHKARGDRSRALLQFEELAEQVDDPRVRLELAKLYEHYVKDHRAALRAIEQGTCESPAETMRRKARLERKLKR